MYTFGIHNILGQWIPQFQYVLHEHASSSEILVPNNFYKDTIIF